MQSNDNEKVTALYCRLSSEDMQKGESYSISNQKALLEEYAGSIGLTNTRFYIDDGYTGVNFQRPDFLRMLEDIKQGIVGTVIVKDLSRLGRNYLMVGQYTELLFPEYQVRFIAISDGVDIANNETPDLMPFKNILNEWVPKDISKKLKTMITQKGQSGKRLTNHPIYGYASDPDDKTKWVIDEEAAKGIVRMFALYKSLQSFTRVAKQLEAEKVIAPAAYSKRANAPDNPYFWNTEQVKQMLQKQEYCGDTVNFRTEKQSYKSKKVIRHAPEDWVIFEDTHPAIIPRQEFMEVQELIRKNAGKKPNRYPKTMLADVLVCAECGSPMYAFRKPEGKTIYGCGLYRRRTGNTDHCTAHYIKESELKEIILTEIQKILRAYRSNAEGFKSLIQKKLLSDDSSTQKEIEQRIQEVKQRQTEIDMYIQGMFEAKVRHELDTEVFRMLSRNYTTERAALNEEMDSLLQARGKKKYTEGEVKKFISVVSKCDEVSELTPEIIADFIDRVEVHEGILVPGFVRKRTPVVDVYFKAVGLMKFDLQ